jgi:hypothetical protein
LLPQISFNANEKVTRASLEALFGTKMPGFPDHSGPFWAPPDGVGRAATMAAPAETAVKERRTS